MKQPGNQFSPNLTSAIMLVLAASGFAFTPAPIQDQGGKPVTVNLPPVQASKLTSATAIQIAAEFCKKVGAPQTVMPTAVYPAPNRFPGHPDSYWLPHWRISFANEARVEVDDSSGTVISYYNSGLVDRLDVTYKPVGGPLSKAAATNIADKVIAAAGPLGSISSPVAFRVVPLMDGNTVPPTPINPIWHIKYNRMYQEIQYHYDQAVTVSLQEVTGELESFGASFLTPPPTNGSGKVTREQAVKASDAVIAKAGLTTAVIDSCTQVVVQPNSLWLEPGYAKTLPGVSRVAWVCIYKAPRTSRAFPYHHDVWIDTETGKIIGGEISAPN